MASLIRCFPVLSLLPLLMQGAQASSVIPEPPKAPPKEVVAALPVSPKPIARFELIKGKLWLGVYSHTVATVNGPMPCWTYATDGMRSANQKEMLLTIKREQGEVESAFDRFLPNLFTTFYRFAEKGQSVDIGDFTQLGRGGTPLLGRPDFLGLVYTAAQPLQGLEVKPDQLAVILVTERELQLGLRLGMTRLLSRLGEATRYYPVPPWADRKRQEVFGPDPEELDSLLAKVRCITVPGVSVRLENDENSAHGPVKVAPPPGGGMTITLPTGRMVLTITPRAAQKLRKAVAEWKTPDGLYLRTEVDPEADSCMVWKPKPAKRMAISKEGGTGERVTGNHLLLVGGQARNEMKGVEDGFGYLLTSKDWSSIREALASGQSFTLPGNAEMPSLVLTWSK